MTAVAITIADLPMVQDITIERGAGGDAASIAVTLPADLAPGEVVLFEIRRGFKLILSRRTDDLDLAVDGDVVTWWPAPHETLAIRAGRVDRYAFTFFRPGASFGVILSGFMIGHDA